MFSQLKQLMTLEEKNNVIVKAKDAAILFCNRNGLSLEKLYKQDCMYFGEIVGFMQEMPYHGKGLLEDLASQPKPTLVYNVDDGTIETTEYTQMYLV